MTRAFIWDLDGTLLDSYDAILAGIEETYTHYGLDFDREGIHAYICGILFKNCWKKSQ